MPGGGHSRQWPPLGALPSGERRPVLMERSGVWEDKNKVIVDTPVSPPRKAPASLPIRIRARYEGASWLVDYRQ